MSGRKRKLSARLMNYNIVLIGTLFVLVVALSLLMYSKIVGEKDYYLMESRIANVEKSKKGDDDTHSTMGWIRVQGTNIDYPVYGSIKNGYSVDNVTESFLWSLNKDSDYHNVLVLYGHNVMNLGQYPRQHDPTFTRMEELMNFVYYDFAKENQYIQLTVGDKNYLYKIFAVGFMEVSELNGFPIGEYSDYAKKTYLSYIHDRSIYDYDIVTSENDDILSVVTCTRFFSNKSSDFMVTGRRVKDGESINQYGVHRNRNYENVENVLKGAGENE